MINNFWDWLNKYPSVDSLKKLNILKGKYLTKDNIKYIHITGTNGKGSVARYLHAILSQKLNFKVGLFTSPHILTINERIIINDQMISDQDLLRIKLLIETDVNKYQLGFFAILTLIALIYFQEQKVSWAILEVGIGGLFDATNIIDSDYAVLTSLAKDHNQILGDNLLSILNQKLGIIKPNTKKFFVSGNIRNSLKQIILQQVVLNQIDQTKIYFSKKISNQGYFLENQTLAFLIINTLFPNLDQNLIWNEIKKTKIPLRFQMMKIFNKTIYFDVAHNLAAINALIKMLKLNQIKIDQIIFSALKVKQPKKLVEKLTNNLTNNIIICENNHHLSIIGEKFNLEKMILKSKENSTILVTGSCYFAALVYQEIFFKKLS
ncbi:MAG: Mur ligase family protein [Spiroplasma sp.]|nr:Mur ligase family protein [Spiroplasma sp.]